MNRRLAMSLVLGTVLSAGALYLAFRNVPMGQLLNYVGTIDYWWVLPSTALLMASFVLRVVRWQLILKSSAQLSFWQAFHPLMIGFMMNCILPARIGEIARPAIIKKRHAVPMFTGIATVAAERVFDVILLVSLFALTMSSVSHQEGIERVYFGQTLNHETLMTIVYGMIRLSGVLLIGIGLVAFGPSRRIIESVITGVFKGVARAVPKVKAMSEYMCSFILKIINNFSLGLSLVQHPAKLLGCILLSICIWGTNIGAFVVFARGCPGIALTWLQLTTVMVMICFFIALPSVPGFWGLWEAAGVFALSFYGVMEDAALGFILVNHAAQMFPIIATGLISAVAMGVNIMQLSREHRSLSVREPM